MAHILRIDQVGKDIRKALARSFQSGNTNFLVGSGASLPAIPVAGQVEQEIVALLEAGNEDQGHLRMYEFLASIQLPTNKLISGEESADNTKTTANYTAFLGIVGNILAERRTTLLPKQATIFTTNYDLFIEKASLNYPALRLNDGFTRVPSLDNRMEYSSRNFFNTTYNTGNLYNYKVEIPCINVVKLHGSLSWKKLADEVVFYVACKKLLDEEKTEGEVRAFNDDYSVVLPQATKFRTTLLDRTYYELLRIFANELDRENTILVTFGFSFGDEHIRDIIRRALKNPTLRLVAFAHGSNDVHTFATLFAGHNNVDIVAPSEGTLIGFEEFNGLLRDLLPKAESGQ